VSTGKRAPPNPTNELPVRAIIIQNERIAKVGTAEDGRTYEFATTGRERLGEYRHKIATGV
jgi:hypothetical protein